MSHDRGCFRCYKDSWEYADCRKPDCPKKDSVKPVVCQQKILGYRYIVGEWAPGEGGWQSFLAHHHRDNLEDAMKIFKVLCETDILYTAYGIVIQPVHNEKEPKK